MRRAFTLVEILIVMGLVAILMTIMLITVTRVARITRQTTQSALRRKHWLQVAEQLRWQLRNLHVPVKLDPPKAGLKAGLVGSHETPLWGEPGNEEGRDTLNFLTSWVSRKSGVCEVGYRLQPRNSGSGLDLGYREFPLRDRSGLHISQAAEAPWRVLLDDVTQFSLDYSDDGWLWRRDWSETKAPRRIRVHLEAERLPVLDFQVTPGMGGGRW